MGVVHVRFAWSRGEITGVLDDIPTARLIIDILPVTSDAHTWGKEVYFRIPVSMELDTHPKQVVPRGTIGFWVQGSSLVLPYGPTPISEQGECRLVTAVNILGHLEGDYTVLDSIKEGDAITVSLV